MAKFEDIHIEWRSEISGICGKYSVLARNLLKPLIRGGAKVKIILDEDYLPPHLKCQNEEWSDIIKDSLSVPESQIRVNQCVPPRFLPARDKINIGYITWETTKLPKDWTPHINQTCHHLLTTSESVSEVAKFSGVTIPVSTIRPSIDCDYWTTEGPKIRVNGVSDTDVKFLYVANFIPRKNLEDLILSFCVAFTGVKDAALIIKTYGQQNTAAQKKAIRQAISTMKSKVVGIPNLPKIVVLDELVSDEQLKRIMRSADVYVSSSKGEGANLPLLQSMALEKMIVANNFLSHGDFLDGSNASIVNHTLTPCINASNPVYTSEQMWCAPDVESFISRLQLAYTSIKTGTHQVMRSNARKTIQSQFDPEKNAESFADKIREIKSNATQPGGSTKDFIHQLAQ